MLKRFIGRLRAANRTPLSYEEQRSRLEQGDLAARRGLARLEATRPEVLYYLAEDSDGGVRQLVAANPSTPFQADRRLTADTDSEVREELARKLGRLLPNLTAREQAALRERTIELIEIMARDQLPSVRRVLAEELKHATNVPRDLIRRLAHDLDLIVAAPILEYSPLFSDEDLLEIVATCRVEGALAALARRNHIPGSVADAIVATLDIPAVAALLANPSARLREDVLDRIIDSAPQVEVWHQPLVLRAELSMRAIRRIASFVASSLINELMIRTDLDEETAQVLARRVRDRVASGDLEGARSGIECLLAELAALHHRNELDEAMIDQAIEGGRRDFVVAALTVRSGITLNGVKQILGSRLAKSVVSLVWRAGLSMRLALKVQRQISLIPQGSLLLPRGGVGYPLTPEEMNWHLEFFTQDSRGTR